MDWRSWSDRLLRRGELYGRPGELHYRRVADPHWFDDRRSKPGSVENGIFSGLDWFPTLTAAKLAETAINYPPMQDPASFNLDAVKKKIDEMIKNRPGQ